MYLHHLVAKIEAPNRQDFKLLRTWMQDPSMGNVFLLGAYSDTWEDFDDAELVCLQPRAVDSLLARFFTDSLVRWYHRIIGYLFRVFFQPIAHTLNRLALAACDPNTLEPK